MAYGLSNGHVTDASRDPQRCRDAVRSAILATTWLLVSTPPSFDAPSRRTHCDIKLSLFYTQLKTTFNGLQFDNLVADNTFYLHSSSRC